MKKMIIAMMLSASVVLMGCGASEPTVLDQKCVEIQKARGTAESQIKSMCTSPASAQ